MGHSKSHLGGSTNDLNTTSNRGSRVPSVLSARNSESSEAITESDRNFFADPERFDNTLAMHKSKSTRSAMGGSIGSIMERSSEFERESEICDESWQVGGEKGKDQGETRGAVNSGLGSASKGRR